MWKIGPECRAACEMRTCQRDELRRAQCLRHRPLRFRHRGRAAGGRRCGLPRRRAHQEGGRDQQRPGRDPNHQHRGAPVIGRDQPACERRDRQRRHAHAGRHQRYRKAAMVLDPGARHRDHWRIETAGRDPDQHAEEELQLPQGGGLLAPTSPIPSSTLPASTTMRVPKRSDNVPQKKAASPMKRKSMVEAAEMPLFDQPIAVEIGCRKTASDIIVPKPTQVLSARRRRRRSSHRTIGWARSCVPRHFLDCCGLSRRNGGPFTPAGQGGVAHGRSASTRRTDGGVHPTRRRHGGIGCMRAV